MNQCIASFLTRHNFSVRQDINSVIDGLLYDMNEGLSGRKACQDMIRTYTNPPESKARNKSVIVIDAGGTNFRSCLVTFDENGKPAISDMEKTCMPGVAKELSKKEFFDQFASNLEHLKDKADCIGFCFSYPMTITEDGDGVLINFTKEVKAPEVVGSHIGKELSKALKEHGWKKDVKVSLLNDTVAALLAGAADPDEGMEYSSYIGFILGTGMNGAYIQSEDEKYPGLKKQIIVCENGKFKDVLQSDFDVAFDKKSVNPGTGLMEKLCSGAYLGPVCYEALILAAKEGIFSDKVCDALSKLEGLTLIEANSFLHAPHLASSMLGSLLISNGASCQDYDRIIQLLDAFMDRSARMAAAILSACAIKSGEGKCAGKPVCMLCDGTTFYKAYKVHGRVFAYLEKCLTEERGIFFDIISRDNDITLGAAIAGLIK